MRRIKLSPDLNLGSGGDPIPWSMLAKLSRVYSEIPSILSLIHHHYVPGRTTFQDPDLGYSGRILTCLETVKR